MATQEIPETIYMTAAQIRKLARLARLHSSNAVVRVESAEAQAEAINVEFLDEYGYRVPGLNGGRRAGYGFVIRENGWSNPPVKRAGEILANAR